MGKGPLVCCLFLIFSTAVFSQGRDKDCNGFFRWDVKTLTDPGGVGLLSATISDEALSHLVLVHPPKHFFILSKKDGRLPRYHDESVAVKVVAIIVSVKTERDQDLHIFMKSPDSDKTMIGEIPYPGCPIFDSLPELRQVYTAARQQLQQVTDLLKSTNKPVKVEITGVPFWDARHWWLRGGARNGREIHPVLSVKILSGE
jgi:hypothetical protein